MTRRPLGITVLGALVILGGIASVLIGLAGLFVSLAGLIPDSGIEFWPLFVGGLIFLLLGIVLVVAGGGLLSLRMWAWWLAVIAVALALTNLAFRIWTTQVAGPVDLLVATLLVVVLAYLVSVYRRFRARAVPS